MPETPHKIIDDVLPIESFDKLKDFIVFNNQFPLTIDGGVGYGPDNKDYDKEKEEDNRNWYASHVSYINNVPISNSFETIASILSPIFEAVNLKSLLRVKTNFYPYTHEIFEHSPHRDYGFDCIAGVLSLNTCDGFTRLEDGTKVDSVANRLLLFNSSLNHNSSTTTNAKGRYNININYI